MQFIDANAAKAKLKYDLITVTFSCLCNITTTTTTTTTRFIFMDRTVYKTNRSYFIIFIYYICIYFLFYVSNIHIFCPFRIYVVYRSLELPCLLYSFFYYPIPMLTISIHILFLITHISPYLSIFLSHSFSSNLFAYAIESNILPNVFRIYWNCRESLLFASGISSSTKLPPSNTQAPGPYKFSTFKYNPLDGDVVGVQEIPMQSTYDRRDASITPNRLESTSPGVVYTYEHPNKYETPSPAPSSTTTSLRTFGSGPKKNAVKMEQSQLMLEIRNSAPDVIIMTSHWFRYFNNNINNKPNEEEGERKKKQTFY